MVSDVRGAGSGWIAATQLSDAHRRAYTELLMPKCSSKAVFVTSGAGKKKRKKREEDK